MSNNIEKCYDGMVYNWSLKLNAGFFVKNRIKHPSTQCTSEHFSMCRSDERLVRIFVFWINRQTSFSACDCMCVTAGTRGSLQWRNNKHDGVSNHQPHDGLLNLYAGAHQRKHQSSASLAFMRGIHRWLVKSPHKGLVMRKMFSFDDVIMCA